MPLNIAGLLVPFQLLFRPRLVLPHLSVPDIRHLDFRALKQAGYKGAVFDKDNCLTLPHKDTLVPQLAEAWAECKAAFGRDNVLVVSNSAGTLEDVGDIASEAVTYHLGVPVLRHASLKPSYACIAGIRTYFASLTTPVRDAELLVVGDRVFTDIVMARRMEPWRPAQGGRSTNAVVEAMVENGAGHPASFSSPSSPASAPAPTLSTTPSTPVASPSLSGPLSILTTSVWEREATLMRAMERALVRGVRRWTNAPPPTHTAPSPPNEEDLRRTFVRRAILDADAEAEREARRRMGGEARMRGLNAHAM